MSGEADYWYAETTRARARIEELELDVWRLEEERDVAKHMEEQFHDACRFLLYGRGASRFQHLDHVQSLVTPD